MAADDLAFLAATEQRRLIASKEVSPVELTELYLDRIERLDPQLNSYLTVSRDEAMRSARSAEAAVVRGEHLGPLHGVPTSIKDLELTRGIRTTSGSLIFKDRVPDVDSVVVERVRRSGAVILGKTNTPEFGLLGRTENRLGVPCRNPWNTERTAGGSSGGAAAAIATGLCALATGSDGGGSIRIPASFCGIYGIKPTQGRIPYYAGPAAPGVTNLFSQSGPMTRTVRDAALLLQVLAGHDSRDTGSLRDAPADYLTAADRGVDGLRFAWSPDFGYAPIDPEVRRLAQQGAKAFEDMGCVVEETDLGLDSPFDSFWLLFCAVASARSPTILAEHSEDLTDYGRECFEHGAKATGADFAKALGQIDILKAQFAEVFETYDLVLTPTVAVTAFPHRNPPKEIDGKEVHWFWGYLPHTYPINMIGHPAATIPCGFSPDGLPIGLHIIGRRGDEATVIAASAAFEHARPWAHHRPPIR